MCGIAGLIARHPVNPAALDHLAQLQAHRGPDEQGRWLSDDGCVGFSHRRLSIIDLSPGGRQPMRHASGDVVLCYNGEIYNYVELADRLRAEGSTFSSRSDSEVLIEAYRRWGERFLAELNGMFAFALYDRRRRRMICARDRYGEKPFLYAAGPDCFAFASEYKALLALDTVDSAVDAARALRFLARGSEGLDDERQTVFPAISQLLPGEYLIVEADTLQVTVSRYWTLAADPDAARLSLPDAAFRLRELLMDSVRLRLRSDVPVGSCLSGGLDSSSIVCLARWLAGPAAVYHAFAGRFPGTDADEGPYISAVAAATGVTLHETQPLPNRLVEELPSFIWHNELPVGSASQYAQWCVFRLARQNGVGVLLDGQGGDELLGGYEQYFRPYVDEEGKSAEEREAVRRRYPRALATPGEMLKTALPAGLRRFLAQQCSRGSDFTFGLAPEVAARAALPPTGGGNAFSGLKSALFRESFRTVLPTLLRYGDRNSMAHSLEVRLPFCDHRLAEFAFALPSSYLMGDAQTKRLLREAMRGFLPEMVRSRWGKQGFVPPQGVWMADGLLSEVEAVIEDSCFVRRGWWNVQWWRRAVTRFRAGESHLAATLWKAFIMEAWQREFVERVGREPTISVFDRATVDARDFRQPLPS